MKIVVKFIEKPGSKDDSDKSDFHLNGFRVNSVELFTSKHISGILLGKNIKFLIQVIYLDHPKARPDKSYPNLNHPKIQAFLNANTRMIH